MTFFSKLFGKKAPTSVEQEIVSQDEIMKRVPDVDQSIFIEDRHPESIFPKPAATKDSIPKSILEDLKSEDYYAMGKKDGYEDHELELQEMHVDIIASRFREAYQKALEELEERIEMMGMYLKPDLEEAMPEQYELIHTKWDILVKQRRDLLMQMDLAVTGEGYIEKSVRYYKAGFRKGMALYLEDQLLSPRTKTL